MSLELFRLVREAANRPVSESDVSALIAGGADVNGWDGSTTPLMCAVQAQNADLVGLLLKAKAQPDTADQKGVTPLHMAVFDGMHSVVQRLLDGGAQVDSRDRHAQTPLFFAPDRETCIKLYSAKADISALNAKGQTALHLAAHAGLNDTVLWMLEVMTPAMVNLTDKHGRTAVYCAARSNLKATIMLLQEHGADINIRPAGYYRKGTQQRQKTEATPAVEVAAAATEASATKKQAPPVQVEVAAEPAVVEEPNPEPTTEMDQKLTVISPKGNHKHINDLHEGPDLEVLSALEKELPSQVEVAAQPESSVRPSETEERSLPPDDTAALQEQQQRQQQQQQAEQGEAAKKEQHAAEEEARRRQLEEQAEAAKRQQEAEAAEAAQKQQEAEAARQQEEAAAAAQRQQEAEAEAAKKRQQEQEEENARLRTYLSKCKEDLDRALR
mmetsp:Transcript_67882/g.162964  ORF Transcript_67882/g.162964 Transcript_67882/m.162964 type:complete len:442 (-) Transcript_67882:84-1409(-)